MLELETNVHVCPHSQVEATELIAAVDQSGLNLNVATLVCVHVIIIYNIQYIIILQMKRVIPTEAYVLG